MDTRNLNLVGALLLQDPVTGEELRPFSSLAIEGEYTVMDVCNEDGSRKWRHWIRTEEI